MNKRFLRLLQLSLALLDFVSIIMIYFSAEFLFKEHKLISMHIEYAQFGFTLCAAWLVVAFVGNIYRERYVTSFEQFTKASLHAYVYFVLLITIYLFFFRLLALSRIFILIVFAGVSISLFINRALYLGLYHYYRKKEWLMSKVVIIGYNKLSKKLVDYLNEEGINKEIIGFCEEYDNVHELSQYPILCGVGNIIEVCKKHNVTEIYSTIAPEQNLNIYNLIQKADDNCIHFRIVPDMALFVNKQIHIDHIKEMLVISLRNEPLEDLGNRIKKRLLDVFISLLITLFILSWLIPIISLCIWSGSKGDIFFRQPRTGKDKKIFSCLKFRTMRLNSEAESQQATRNDLRITRLGNFLRRTSLDELPQFINVLRGDMSIVGPRPHMLRHTDQYSKLIGQYMVRQFLKPGITGWAQVNGFRGETKTLEQMTQRVEHDLWYMENWSLLLDFRIILMTALGIVRGDKNAF